jgi:uncharacterized protein YqhQ
MSKQHYGGQAVLEGVMMRGTRRATVAVRRADGSIVTYHENLDSTKRSRLEALPVLRGVLLLWDTLNLGVRALNVSAAADLPADEQPSTAETVGSVALSLALGFCYSPTRCSGSTSVTCSSWCSKTFSNWSFSSAI